MLRHIAVPGLEQDIPINLLSWTIFTVEAVKQASRNAQGLLDIVAVNTVMMQVLYAVSVFVVLLNPFRLLLPQIQYSGSSKHVSMF